MDTGNNRHVSRPALFSAALFAAPLVGPHGPDHPYKRRGGARTSRRVHAERPPRQRLRCVLDMLSSLEVKVLWPTRWR